MTELAYYSSPRDLAPRGYLGYPRHPLGLRLLGKMARMAICRGYGVPRNHVWEDPGPQEPRLRTYPIIPSTRARGIY